MTCATSEQYEHYCKGEFAEIHRKLDVMDEAIRGNGRVGVKVRARPYMGQAFKPSSATIHFLEAKRPPPLYRP